MGGIWRTAHVMEKGIVQTAYKRIARRKTKTVAKNRPQNADPRHQGKTLHHRPEDMLLSHEPAVEKCEALRRQAPSDAWAARRQKKSARRKSADSPRCRGRRFSTEGASKRNLDCEGSRLFGRVQRFREKRSRSEHDSASLQNAYKRRFNAPSEYHFGAPKIAMRFSIINMRFSENVAADERVLFRK
jgi:hypothetical protein